MDTSRSRQRRSGNQALFALTSLARFLSPRGALLLGRFLGGLAPRLSPRHLRAVRQRMGQALSARFPFEELDDLPPACYRFLGESVMESMRVSHLSREGIADFARLEGREHIEAALCRGRGAVALTAHIGAWELCGSAIAAAGYPVTATAKDQLDDPMTRHLERMRKRVGMKVVRSTDVRAQLRALRDNELVGILADVNATQPSAFADFFGIPAASYFGAAYYGVVAGASILPLFDHRMPDGRHVTRFHAALPISTSGDRQRDLLITTMRIHHVIECEILRRPEQWYWLDDRWKTRPEDVPDPASIPMQHRDMTPAEVEEALAPLRETHPELVL